MSENLIKHDVIIDNVPWDILNESDITKYDLILPLEVWDYIDHLEKFEDFLE